jgi:protein-arginine deiminase
MTGSGDFGWLRLAGRVAPLVVAGALVLPGSAVGAGAPIIDVRADPLTLPGSAARAGAPIADVLADLNHDGVVSPADERLKANPRAAAIVLPNLDDDARRCPRVRLERFSDAQLAACNDASDNVVDGPRDLADMAPVRVRAWPGAPAGTRVRVAVVASQPRRARLFVRRRGTWKPLGTGGALTVTELRRGTKLLMEGRDIVRNRAVWDGSLRVVLRIQARGRVATDVVRFRVAPLLFENQTMPLERVFAAANVVPADNTDSESSGTPIPNVDEHERPIDQRTFETLNLHGRAAYRRQWRAALSDEPNVRLDLLATVNGDRWMQDFYEPAYVSMPGANGSEHTITLLIRSATRNRDAANPPAGHVLRQGSRLLFSQLRGPGVGVVQAYDAARMRRLKLHGNVDTMSSTGNFEAIPPYSNGRARFPNGRMIWGSGGRRTPDPVFIRMLRAQGTQQPVVIDTSWLAVGHVDEIVSFVPNNSRRGWTIAVEDPRAGIRLLQRLRAAGAGAARMFAGLARYGKTDVVRAARTVDSLLADSHEMEATREAARHIDRTLVTLERATGVRDNDVIRVPTLYEREPGGLVSDVPATVNGVPLRPGEFAAPRPHGPIVGGRDAFEAEIEQQFAEHGVRVRWIEDWYYAHIVLGEVHCTSNVLRDPSAATPWWRAGIAAAPRGF